ncbi:MAG: hypothetical protein A2V77_17075 [Anaeromyxobacter sp. RBG_16_69_14]|nr:MAG: hypothetical protein A2V77_17075 [Anaeromyxobacter sp. RBG_16_69_14]
MRSFSRALLALAFVTPSVTSCRCAWTRDEAPARDVPWERETPAVPLPVPPLGTGIDIARSTVKLTPEKVRLGRWLFFDGRLSKDGTVSCATCHRPSRTFSGVSFTVDRAMSIPVPSGGTGRGTAGVSLSHGTSRAGASSRVQAQRHDVTLGVTKARASSARLNERISPPSYDTVTPRVRFERGRSDRFLDASPPPRPAE